MNKYRILNLYACLGGNRYKWDEVADNIEVIAVEIDPYLASMYRERFPGDTLIEGDAHKFLLENYQDFDFVWTSPPCPTHSRARFWGFGANGKNPVYPDMKLYQEIIFLQHHFKGKYCVENVIPYYEPMLNPQKRGRHLYWTNFRLPNTLSERKVKISDGKNEVKNLCAFHDYDFYSYKGEQPINKIARNLVDYEAGRTILETAMEVQRQSNTKQVSLFDALK